MRKNLLAVLILLGSLLLLSSVIASANTEGNSSANSEEVECIEIFNDDGSLETQEISVDSVQQSTYMQNSAGMGIHAFDSVVIDVVKVFGNETTSNKVVLTIMGDGFTDDDNEQELFLSEVTRIANAFLTVYPFNKYKDAFDVYAVKVKSNEPGVTGSSGVGVPQVDNFFGTFLNYNYAD